MPACSAPYPHLAPTHSPPPLPLSPAPTSPAHCALGLTPLGSPWHLTPLGSCRCSRTAQNSLPQPETWSLPGSPPVPSGHQTQSGQLSSSWVPHTCSPTRLAWVPPQPRRLSAGSPCPSWAPCLPAPSVPHRGQAEPSTAHLTASALASPGNSPVYPRDEPLASELPLLLYPHLTTPSPTQRLSHRILSVPLMGRDRPSFQALAPAVTWI